MNAARRDEIFDVSWRQLHDYPLPEYWFVFESQTIGIWMSDFIYNYTYVSLIVAAAYLFFNWFIKMLMENKKAYAITTIASFHYLILLILNTLMVARIVPHLSNVFIKYGFYVSVCVDTTVLADTAMLFWTAFFQFLKMLELIDTFILYLQKRRVSFYYWSHHCIAMIGAWYLYSFYPSLGPWIIFLISTSHIPIYLYMTLKELNIVSRSPIYGKLLLISEILSMVLGTVLGAVTYSYIYDGRFCYTSSTVALASSTLFFICLLLCCIFFVIRTREIVKKTNNDQGNGEIPS